MQSLGGKLSESSFQFDLVLTIISFKTIQNELIIVTSKVSRENFKKFFGFGRSKSGRCWLELNTITTALTSVLYRI